MRSKEAKEIDNIIAWEVTALAFYTALMIAPLILSAVGMVWFVGAFGDSLWAAVGIGAWFLGSAGGFIWWIGIAEDIASSIMSRWMP